MHACWMGWMGLNAKKNIKRALCVSRVMIEYNKRKTQVGWFALVFGRKGGKAEDRKEAHRDHEKISLKVQ